MASPQAHTLERDVIEGVPEREKFDESNGDLTRVPICEIINSIPGSTSKHETLERVPNHDYDESFGEANRDGKRSPNCDHSSLPRSDPRWSPKGVPNYDYEEMFGEANRDGKRSPNRDHSSLPRSDPRWSPKGVSNYDVDEIFGKADQNGRRRLVHSLKLPNVKTFKSVHIRETPKSESPDSNPQWSSKEIPKYNYDELFDESGHDGRGSPSCDHPSLPGSDPWWSPKGVPNYDLDEILGKADHDGNRFINRNHPTARPPNVKTLKSIHIRETPRSVSKRDQINEFRPTLRKSSSDEITKILSDQRQAILDWGVVEGICQGLNDYFLRKLPRSHFNDVTEVDLTHHSYLLELLVTWLQTQASNPGQQFLNHSSLISLPPLLPSARSRFVDEQGNGTPLSCAANSIASALSEQEIDLLLICWSIRSKQPAWYAALRPLPTISFAKMKVSELLPSKLVLLAEEIISSTPKCFLVDIEPTT